MKKLLLLLTLILTPLATAVDYEFLGGSTDKFILVNMYAVADGTAKTGLLYTDITATYMRNNASADVDITEATMTIGTHVDGGWIEVDATNSPGLYQFGIPDAAIAAGAEGVFFSFKATDTFQRFVHVSLIDVDLRNGANVAANTVQIEGVDATDQINTQADLALADYDGPTNAEMNARTLVAVDYFDPAADTVANVTTVAALTGHTAQTADHAASIAAILADTSAVDTTSELRTLLMGSDVAPASTTEIGTAQADLDTLTGTDGVTLATSQPNYAPATASALTTHDGKLDTVDTNVDTLNTNVPDVLSLANINAEVDTALADIHLDHLLAVNYDPDSKPGTATALFNELVESDSGVSRFTANALEQAPGGGGGDATEAKQDTLLDRLAGVMDADHTLTSAVGDFDPATDSLEAIRVRGDAAWAAVGAGSGDTTVTHDTGGADTFQVTDSSGNGIEDVTIQAYVKSEYDTDATSATVRGVATTGPDGRWESPYLKLNAGTEYTLYFHKPGVFGPATATVTP